MIPRGGKLPHERDDEQEAWNDKYGKFTTVNDELTQRWLETHYPVKYDPPQPVQGIVLPTIGDITPNSDTEKKK